MFLWWTTNRSARHVQTGDSCGTNSESSDQVLCFLRKQWESPDGFGELFDPCRGTVDDVDVLPKRDIEMLGVRGSVCEQVFQF